MFDWGCAAVVSVSGSWSFRGVFPKLELGKQLVDDAGAVVSGEKSSLSRNDTVSAALFGSVHGLIGPVDEFV